MYGHSVTGKKIGCRNESRTQFSFNELNGAPGVTRTRDPLLRRQTLYPAELRALRS